MSEMVERVARAICCPHGCRNVDTQYAVCQAGTYRADARAAIEAMREPTEAMVNACVEYAGAYDVQHTEARDNYRAMIAVALT